MKSMWKKTSKKILFLKKWKRTFIFCPFLIFQIQISFKNVFFHYAVIRSKSNLKKFHLCPTILHFFWRFSDLPKWKWTFINVQKAFWGSEKGSIFMHFVFAGICSKNSFLKFHLWPTIKFYFLIICYKKDLGVFYVIII